MKKKSAVVVALRAGRRESEIEYFLQLHIRHICKSKGKIIKRIGENINEGLIRKEQKIFSVYNGGKSGDTNEINYHKSTISRSFSDLGLYLYRFRSR